MGVPRNEPICIQYCIPFYPCHFILIFGFVIFKRLVKPRDEQSGQQL